MSDLQYIPDSDDDNSLPLLPPSSVNLDLLKDFYSFLSPGSKRRLRAEIRKTQFSQLYDQFDNDTANDNEIPCSSAPTEQPENRQRHIRAQKINDPVIPQITNVINSPEADSSLQLSTCLPFSAEHTVDPTADSLSINQGPKERYGARSLRKRNFSSRHPYIADQADWLGICTVDGINEMFSADEDIGKVLRALNNIYTKRKKRYPDEDRYKAKNFYAHLGKNNLLALRGDPDAQPISGPGDQLDAGDDDFDSVVQMEQLNPELDEDEELIPFEELQTSHTRPRIINDDSLSDSQGSAENIQQSDSENTGNESEEEYIKIGGRYRKLKTILRGVLPESAKRLDFFQEHKKPTKKRHVDHLHDIEPRKGLAIRKRGSAQKGVAHHPRSLEDFVNDENLSEVDTTNYLNRANFSGSESPLRTDNISESDYDSIEEVFSKNKETISTFDSIGVNYHIVSSGSDSDSVQEDDRIDHMFASRGQPSSKSKTDSKKRKKSTALVLGKNNRNLVEKMSLVQKSRLGGISRKKSLSMGKLKKKKKPLLSQSTFAITTRINEQSKDNLKHGSKSAIPRTSKGPKSANFQRDDVSNRAKTDQADSGHPHTFVKSVYRRDPVRSTTVFEVESESKFVMIHRPNPSAAAHITNILPVYDGLRSTNSLTPFSTTNDMHRIHTIGDGYIFFSDENEVEIRLAGKTYSFGLYKLKSAARDMDILLNQLRKTLLNPTLLTNLQTRQEIQCALMQLSKWFLIVRENVSAFVWKQIRVMFDDLSKLHTREIRLYQSVFHAQLLFVYYILIKLEPKEEEQDILKSFDTYCSEYWSIYFLTFTVNDLSEKSQNRHILIDSISLLHYIYEKRECTWWNPIIDALGEVGNFNEKNRSLLDMSYILASLFPQDPSNWGPFLTIFNKFKNESLSEDHHYFLDICDLANRNLNWPMEERLITHLYSSLGHRKFGNFSDETAVPQALQIVHSRHDIPNSSVFERFLCLVYDHVSQLLSEKIVKRFISKLVASSQYQYKKGRRYQIMFVNRVNLIILLFQISDTDLKNQLTNLIEQVKSSKDMFVYGRAVDAVEIFCEIGQRKGKTIPWSSFQSLLELFCSEYASLFGMPNLLKRTMNILVLQLPSLENVGDVLEAFKLFKLIDVFPDPVLEVALRHVAIFCLKINQKWKTRFTDRDIEALSDFQRHFLNFLSNVMKRLPISNIQHQNLTDNIIELSIQIWINISRVTDSYSWNIIVLQKYSYLGNLFLRERFLMFLCIQLMEDESIMAKYEINEIDIIVLKQLCSPTLSPYLPRLLNSLSKRQESIFNKKGVNFGNFNSVSQVATYRSQMISLIIQSICSASFNEREGKEYLLALVGQLKHEYFKHFNDSNVVDFCKRIMEVVHRFAKDKTDDLDDIWEFAAKLGFPRKKKNESWNTFTEQEKLQKANYEFIDALNYNRAIHTILDDLPTADNTHILFSLIQIYIEAVKINGAYWIHLAYLLRYALAKLESFQIFVHDVKFKSFLDLTGDVSIISSRWKNTTHVMYELEALTMCAQILRRAHYIYLGYKEILDVHEYILIFLTKIDQFDSGHEIRQLFTATSFGMLRSVSHRNLNPNFDHSEEEYENALADQNVLLVSLRRLVDGNKDQDNTSILMDFEFTLEARGPK